MGPARARLRAERRLAAGRLRADPLKADRRRTDLQTIRRKKVRRAVPAIPGPRIPEPEAPRAVPPAARSAFESVSWVHLETRPATLALTRRPARAGRLRIWRQPASKSVRTGEICGYLGSFPVCRFLSLCYSARRYPVQRNPKVVPGSANPRKS